MPANAAPHDHADCSQSAARASAPPDDAGVAHRHDLDAAESAHDDTSAAHEHPAKTSHEHGGAPSHSKGKCCGWMCSAATIPAFFDASQQDFPALLKVETSPLAVLSPKLATLDRPPRPLTHAR